jgi:hypothetical protein
MFYVVTGRLRSQLYFESPKLSTVSNNKIYLCLTSSYEMWSWNAISRIKIREYLLDNKSFPARSDPRLG